MGKDIIKEDTIPTMSNKDIQISYEIEKELLKLEQSSITTIHSLHSGLYTRTIMLHKDEALSSAVIKIPTTLMINGNVNIFIGKDTQHICGFQVILADKGRKQIMYAHEDSVITMCFQTKAKTIEEAEEEFTDDHKLLMSRSDSAINIIKKGLICQEQ